MNNKHLEFLINISELLTKEIEISDLSEKIKTFLLSYIAIKEIVFYVYDNASNTLRNCCEAWGVIDENYEKHVYDAYENIKGNDYIINSKAYRLSEFTDIELHSNDIYAPLSSDNKNFGIVKLVLEEKKSISQEFLSLLKIFSSQLSLKLLNIVLNEQSKINVEFHDSMKNIAKIIETQYELNYIVPIIGEMLDRFISDHLIYVFLYRNDEYQLVWPNACNDERIFETLKQLTADTEYLLTNNDKIGAFPLTGEGNITGCIVARSTLDSLSKRDISYLEQLTRQSAITISRAEAYSKVLQYATIDALTNLNNRRQFEIRLRQEIATTKRQNNPLCAMMIDIDFFKSVNDTYGHANGDEVLRKVAQVIKEQLRESDIPSRYGGEEFAVLLPYTHIKDAQIVGERLRNTVAKTQIEINSDNFDVKNINVTISMGLAEFNKNETGEELFERADKALYNAKESGRNKVVII